MSNHDVIRIGTRRSDLALTQTDLVVAALQAERPDVLVEVVPMSTKGDEDMRSFAEVGGRGIFAHDLERALAAGEIDAVVHSSKDLELRSRSDLQLAAWLPRADPRDALVVFGTARGVAELPDGATIATSSVRRTAALRTLRTDLAPVAIRGNVATRIATSRERGDSAVMLAQAGLDRLSLSDDLNVVPLHVRDCVPEAGQGAVVVQTRGDDAADVWKAIDDVRTRRTVSLERELAHLLGGGCEHPVGVHVELEAGRVHAFVSRSGSQAGTIMCLDIVGLELAPLLSVTSPADIDDAVHSIAPTIYSMVTAELGTSPAP